MKKILSILLALVCIISVACAFGGCGEKQPNGKLEKGNFYTVTEAYENGYLTLEQVKSIAYYNNGGTIWNEDIMGEDYVPLPKDPEKPSEETDTALINSFYNSERWVKYENYFTKEDIRYGYFGTYGNAIAVKIGVKGEAVSEVVWEEIIDGVTVYYRNEKRVLIWLNTI